MNDRRLKSDIISTLPQHIAEHILTRMPIRDALRTSILSRKWRYSWTSIPKLVFDDSLFEVESDYQDLKRHKFIDAIFHVLLLHKGPILDLSLSVDKIEMISKFDLILLHLSRSNTLTSLKIQILNGLYKLPAWFFSLQGLQVLKLTNCDFETPLSFKGFNRLRTMDFRNFEASGKILQPFLSNCPLLQDVTLLGGEDEDNLMDGEKYADDLRGRNTSIFVELLPCLPLIQSLEVSNYYMKYMAAGRMPHKLPTSLVHLKCLYLDVCLREQDEISSALCMITSSPNLEEISFLMYDNEKLHARQTSVNFLHRQYHMDLNLDRLEKFEILMFSNLAIEMELLKLIMAKSPVLKTARIELNDNISVDEELKILRDFIPLPFSPASPSTRLVIERPKLPS